MPLNGWSFGTWVRLSLVAIVVGIGIPLSATLSLRARDASWFIGLVTLMPGAAFGAVFAAASTLGIVGRRWCWVGCLGGGLAVSLLLWPSRTHIAGFWPLIILMMFSLIVMILVDMSTTFRRDLPVIAGGVAGPCGAGLGGEAGSGDVVVAQSGGDDRGGHVEHVLADRGGAAGDGRDAEGVHQG